jgi:hypothetical protein
VLCAEYDEARATLEEYKRLCGERDGQDIATMRILARILGVSAPSERLNGDPMDEHEHRLQAAVTVLRDRRVRAKASASS